MTLDPPFLSRPIAHRGYHDPEGARPENSREAFAAAIEAGYGIELDLQMSADGVPMVFHDTHLNRLTGETGPVAMRSADDLRGIGLSGGATTIPTLVEVLALVDGRVPLLIELKDQDGQMGPNTGRLENGVARALAGYAGPVAAMSFNPHSVAAMAEVAPDIPRGLVTSAFRRGPWAPLPAEVCDRLRGIPDYDRVGASFISHEAADLGRARVAELKAAGAAILCWTVRSTAQEHKAREVADNVTFEGYPA